MSKLETIDQIREAVKSIPDKYNHPLFGVIIPLCDQVATLQTRLTKAEGLIDTIGNWAAKMTKGMRVQASAKPNGQANGHAAPTAAAPAPTDQAQTVPPGTYAAAPDAREDGTGFSNVLDHLPPGSRALEDAMDAIPDDQERAARFASGKEHGQ